MLRVAYHAALDATDADLKRLGVQLIDALSAAVKAIETGDTSLAARIITEADQTGNLAQHIERACIELIWKQQPVAGELRQVAAMFEVGTDFQRINYYTVDLAKHAVRLAGTQARPAWETVKEVAYEVERGLRLAVDAYRARDLARAKAAQDDGDRFERLYGAGIKALQHAISGDATILSAGTEILFVLTSLQRIGEHAVSIAWHTQEMLEP